MGAPVMSRESHQANKALVRERGKGKTFVYIAGPYMGRERKHDSSEYCEIDQNINEARSWAVALAYNLIPFFCPHLNSAHFEVITPHVLPEFWYDMDMRILRVASALFLLPDWQRSPGTVKEKEEAERLGIPIFQAHDLAALVDWWQRPESPA